MKNSIKYFIGAAISLNYIISYLVYMYAVNSPEFLESLIALPSTYSVFMF